MEELQKLDDKKNPNGKIVMLKERLEKLFEKTPGSKIIIFVQIRKVAVFMANLLNSLNRCVFKAKEFISTGSNENDAGTNTTCRYQMKLRRPGKRLVDFLSILNKYYIKI